MQDISQNDINNRFNSANACNADVFFMRTVPILYTLLLIFDQCANNTSCLKRIQIQYTNLLGTHPVDYSCI